MVSFALKDFKFIAPVESSNYKRLIIVVCGQPGPPKRQKKLSRIIGGEETEIDEFPWMGRIVRKFEETPSWCGATLISSRHAITSMECV